MSFPDDRARNVDQHRLRLSGYALAIWSFAYMIPHLYWAVGGTFGLSALHPDAPNLPQWQVINGVASVILLCASTLGWLFVSFRNAPGLRPLLLLAGGAGCAIALSHGLYGIIYRLPVLFAGETNVPDWILWDLLLFEPWFMIEGVLLATTGWFFLENRSARLVWAWACAAGTLVFLAAASLEVRIG